MRKVSLALGSVVLQAAAVVAVPAVASAAPSTEYVVLYAGDAAAGRSAVRAIGGTIVRENTAVGLATVRTANGRFLAEVRTQDALVGAARNRAVGRAPEVRRAQIDAVEKEGRDGPPSHAGPVARAGGQPGSDPLAPLQWDMEMINATPDGSYAVQAGDRRKKRARIRSRVWSSRVARLSRFTLRQT